jgi:hypothetical protein
MPVDLASVAAELLDRLPANRTLGLTITEVHDGLGRAALPVSEGVRNVIGALHSSGVAALDQLFGGDDGRARFTTLTVIDGDEAPRAAEAEFDWVVRLAPVG